MHQQRSSRALFDYKMRRVTWAWTRTASIAKSDHTSSLFELACRELPLTVLTWTRGRTNISPATNVPRQKGKPWDETSTDECQDSSSVAESGTSTKSYTARAFAKALAQAISKRPKRS